MKAEVQVTNCGQRAGKDVVQVYFSAPYQKGGLEKSAICLAGYAKTELLARRLSNGNCPIRLF